MQAMILAAGFGSRLRPHTNSLPKPLFPVGPTPLLLHIIRQVRHLAPDRIVVNSHHLRHKIAALVAAHARQDVSLQEETEILGTGGALRRALPLFDDSPLLVCNADIFHTIDLHGLVAAHLAHDGPVSLAVHDYHCFNKVLVDEDGMVRSFTGNDGNQGGRLVAFTGIHVMDPAILERIPAGRFFDIISLYTDLIRQGIPVRTVEVRDHYWRDIGTPAGYLALHDDIFSSGMLKKELGLPAPVRQYIAEDARLGNDVTIRQWAVVSPGCQVGEGALLQRAVLLPGARLAAGKRAVDCIVSADAYPEN